jgi:hypothetical protein
MPQQVITLSRNLPGTIPGPAGPIPAGIGDYAFAFQGYGGVGGGYGYRGWLGSYRIEHSSTFSLTGDTAGVTNQSLGGGILPNVSTRIGVRSFVPGLINLPTGHINVNGWEIQSPFGR